MNVAKVNDERMDDFNTMGIEFVIRLADRRVIFTGGFDDTDSLLAIIQEGKPIGGTEHPGAASWMAFYVNPAHLVTIEDVRGPVN